MGYTEGGIRASGGWCCSGLGRTAETGSRPSSKPQRRGGTQRWPHGPGRTAVRIDVRSQITTKTIRLKADRAAAAPLTAVGHLDDSEGCVCRLVAEDLHVVNW